MSNKKCPHDNSAMENMGKLQNSIVEVIDKANLPLPDLHMVLTVLLRQVEGIFISQLRLPKNGKT